MMGTGENLTLMAVDGASGQILYSFPIASSCAGNGGGTLAVDETTDQIFVGFYGQQYLLTLDGANCHVVNMFSDATASYIAISPSFNQLYVVIGQYLIALEDVTNLTYVDTGLLTQGTCLP